ncbi:MAG: transcription elongation factor GreA, partial [Solirubrobacteraceae bacterium]|nr:transcription elongation factor GreA [Solirubrobacteraceae bacterium]
TAQGLEDLKAEIAMLEGDERRRIAERILRARELGDLSENAEYHAAKEDQAHLETRILRLLSRLRSARVVDVPEGGDVVSFGSKVTFVDEATGKEQTFTLVGTTEQDLKTGKLSAESPMARALIGAKVGKTVKVQTPGGVRKLRVERVG